MSSEEREAYYRSDAYKKKTGWYMNTDPHCNHYFYHVQLNATIRLTYHLSLLPHWKQIEDRTRVLLDAALQAAPTTQAGRRPR